MYAVIMAGGGGTRLWPLSRSRRPKPFLPLLEGDRTLLEAGVSRLAPLIAPEDVYIVTDARYAPLVREVAPQVPAANIIGEPFGRNTAAAVALMAHAIDRPRTRSWWCCRPTRPCATRRASAPPWLPPPSGRPRATW